MEYLALDGAALEHRSLRLLELVEPRSEESLQVGRNRNIAFRLSAIATISVTKSGLPPAARAIRSRSRPGRSPG